MQEKHRSLICPQIATIYIKTSTSSLQVYLKSLDVFVIAPNLPIFKFGPLQKSTSKNYVHFAYKQENYIYYYTHIHIQEDIFKWNA